MKQREFRFNPKGAVLNVALAIVVALVFRYFDV